MGILKVSGKSPGSKVFSSFVDIACPDGAVFYRVESTNTQVIQNEEDEEGWSNAPLKVLAAGTTVITIHWRDADSQTRQTTMKVIAA